MLLGCVGFSGVGTLRELRHRRAAANAEAPAHPWQGACHLGQKTGMAQPPFHRPDSSSTAETQVSRKQAGAGLKPGTDPEALTQRNLLDRRRRHGAGQDDAVRSLPGGHGSQPPHPARHRAGAQDAAGAVGRRAAALRACRPRVRVPRHQRRRQESTRACAAASSWL